MSSRYDSSSRYTEASDGHPTGENCCAGALSVRVRMPNDVPLAVIEQGPWVEPPLVLLRDGEGNAELHAATYDLEAAARWVLARGAETEAVEPPALRKRVATEAWHIYRRYRADAVRLRTR